MGDWTQHIPAFAALAVLLLLSGFFSGSETALLSLSRALVRRMQSGSAGERAAAKLLAAPQRLLSTLLVGNMTVNVLLTSLSASLVEHWVSGGKGRIMAVNIAVVWPLLMVFGELTPKTLAYNHAPVLSRAVALPLTLCVWVTAPVRELLRLAAQVVLRILGFRQGAQWDRVTPDEVRAMVAVAEESGTAGHHERELVERILRLGNTQASEIMIPRMEIVGLRDDATLAEAFSAARRCRHAHLPVYHEDLDDIWGILSTADLPRWRLSPLLETRLADFRAALGARPDPAAATPGTTLPVFPVTMMPETVRVDALVTAVRRTRAHLFVLVNEYGGTSGILTLNDILEEVVGQITSTDGDGKVRFQRVGTGFVIDGRMALRDMAARTGVVVEAPGCDTLSGFLMQRLGRMARPGDEVVAAGYRFRVQRMAGRRAGSVEAVPLAPLSAVGNGGGPPA